MRTTEVASETQTTQAYFQDGLTKFQSLIAKHFTHHLRTSFDTLIPFRLSESNYCQQRTRINESVDSDSDRSEVIEEKQEDTTRQFEEGEFNNSQEQISFVEIINTSIQVQTLHTQEERIEEQQQMQLDRESLQNEIESSEISIISLDNMQEYETSESEVSIDSLINEDEQHLNEYESEDETELLKYL